MATSPPGSAAEAITGPLSSDTNPPELTLRMIMQHKEAGVVIGTAGRAIADLRQATGVYAGVSEAIPHNDNRILRVAGSLAGVSRAYCIVARTLLQAVSKTGKGTRRTAAGAYTMWFLISHHHMSKIIGPRGGTLRSIQEAAGVRLDPEPSMLPQSTERLVQIEGTPEAIEAAVQQIGQHVVDDPVATKYTILYDPARHSMEASRPDPPADVLPAAYRDGYFVYPPDPIQSAPTATPGSAPSHAPGPPPSNDIQSGQETPAVPDVDTTVEEELHERIELPASIIGHVIGRSGQTAARLRHRSGARIFIAPQSHTDAGDRRITVSGSREAIDRAINLIYELTAAETTRRRHQEQ